MKTRDLRYWFLVVVGVICVFPSMAPAQSAAKIKIWAVPPRIADEFTTDIYDMKSTGLDVVGINKRVYLVPDPDSAFVGSITDYVWSIVGEPAAGAAVVDSNTADLFKFHPTAGGAYTVRLVPWVSGAATTPTTQRIYAAKFVGTGTEGGNTPAPPNCGTSFCHGDLASSSRLMKVTEWLGTEHAHKLENHLNGLEGSFYSVSCLACHTLGYDDVTQGNDNFHQIAQDIAFNLDQIPTWVAEAATSGIMHWNDLPTQLQLKSNIQCEACHGPGSDHNGNTANIASPKYDAENCRQCHDAPSHHIKFAQYDNSKHTGTNTVGNVDRSSCHPCHIGEGFLFIRGEGETEIPAEVTSRGPLNCVSCHDPHSHENEHQLRTTATVTLPNGALFSGGLGNVCANCHNSRISDPANTIRTSRRGAHHSPVADVLMGMSAYDWGHPYPAGPSAHYLTAPDVCVTCHMAEAPSTDTTYSIGGHTWEINSATASNAANACGGCHPGTITTDRVPKVPVDYDGDGSMSGIQTEVGNLLANVQAEILARVPGTSYDTDEQKIAIDEVDWLPLPFNTRAVLYNFNLCSEEKSRGVHNTKYVVAVLQRAYMVLTGHSYAEDYPQAKIVDEFFTSVRTSTWQYYR